MASYKASPLEIAGLIGAGASIVTFLGAYAWGVKETNEYYDGWPQIKNPVVRKTMLCSLCAFPISIWVGVIGCYTKTPN